MLAQRVLLESDHPADHGGVGEVLGADEHIDLAGDVGGVLKQLRVLERLEVGWHEVADIGDDLGLGVRDPAEHRDREAGQQHAPGVRQRPAQRRAPGASERRTHAPKGGRATSVKPRAHARERRWQIFRPRAVVPLDERGEPTGQRQHEREDDPDDQRHGEAAHHRYRR